MKKIVFIISLIIMCTLLIYLYFENDFKENNEKSYIEIENLNIKEEVLNVTDYNIYGRYFNITFNMNNTNEINIDNLKLVLKSIDKEIEILYFYTIDNDIITFKTNQLLNEGIVLDDLFIDNYYILLKDTTDNSYYTFKNGSNYSDMTYYTITKNKKNNKIDISFADNVKNDIVSSGLNINVTRTILPSNVYDIAIDAGHGGKDPGAIGVLNGTTYYEKDINLVIAKEVADKLTKMGYKILLTRETDINIESYGTEGRAVSPNKYQTKLSISIHNNSTGIYLNYGGLEIYIANNTNPKLAELMSNNIIKETGTSYSSKKSDKILDGVYFMPFKEYSIKEALEEWQLRGYVPYELNNEIPYMFMIRELGGLNTHAYVDGRNEAHGFNPYYNSNHTTEPYLLELGYMIHAEDLNNLLNNHELYSDSISNSINEYLLQS